jgi:putative membrane protein
MNILVRLIISTLSVFGGAYLLPGVHIKNFTTAIAVAVVLALLNAFVKPILIMLTIPVTIITLGLFLLVINAAMILLCSKLVNGFSVDGWLYAMLYSMLISVISGTLSSLGK